MRDRRKQVAEEGHASRRVDSPDEVTTAQGNPAWSNRIESVERMDGHSIPSEISPMPALGDMISKSPLGSSDGPIIVNFNIQITDTTTFFMTGPSSVFLLPPFAPMKLLDLVVPSGD
jgi:hypothetical protein